MKMVRSTQSQSRELERLRHVSSAAVLPQARSVASCDKGIPGCMRQHHIGTPGIHCRLEATVNHDIALNWEAERKRIGKHSTAKL